MPASRHERAAHANASGAAPERWVHHVEVLHEAGIRRRWVCGSQAFEFCSHWGRQVRCLGSERNAACQGTRCSQRSQ